MFERGLTSEELQQLSDQALAQLADAILEYKQARLKAAANDPNEDLSKRRLAIAHESVMLCLDTCHRHANVLRKAKG